MDKKYLAKELTIVVDFDGCIAIAEPAKIKYAKLYQQINITSKTCMKATYNLGPIMYKQLMEKIMREHTDEYVLDPQCKEVLTFLHEQGFRIVVVTARDGETLRTCKQFLKKHQLPINEVFGTNDQSKGPICKKIQALTIIEDTLSKLTELLNLPIYMNFLQRDWNTHEVVTKELEKRISTISSWKEFAKKTLEAKEMNEAICYFRNIINSPAHFTEIHAIIHKDPVYAKRSLKEYRRLHS